MAFNLAPSERDPQRLVDAIRQLTQGRLDAVGVVTLRANQTTTTVSAVNCSKSSSVILFQTTANAAAALATTYIPQANVAQGSFTIVHASAATIDRTFFWIAIG